MNKTEEEKKKEEEQKRLREQQEALTPYLGERVDPEVQVIVE